MKASLTLKLGSKLLKLEGEGNETKIITALSFWSQLPDHCNCGSTNLSLFNRATVKGDYYGLKCLDCGADLTFHELKAGGFYVKKEDSFIIYQAGTALPEPPQQPSLPGNQPPQRKQAAATQRQQVVNADYQDVDPNDTDDIPF